MLQPEDPVARRGESRVVRGDDRRQAVLGVHLAQQRMQRVGGRLVEIAGRLVGQQQRRLHHQRPRHGHALLLAARQHPRPVLEPLAEADAPSSVARHGRAFRRGSRAIRIGISTFSSGVELRQQVVELEDEPDVAVAELDQRRVAHRRQVVPADARSPASARSRPPSRCSSVLLPTPDAPTIATISPWPPRAPGRAARESAARPRCRTCSGRVTRDERRHATRSAAPAPGRASRPGATDRASPGSRSRPTRARRRDEIARQHHERHVRDLVDVLRDV